MALNVGQCLLQNPEQRHGYARGWPRVAEPVPVRDRYTAALLELDRQLADSRARNRCEYVGIAERPRGQHRAMDGRHESLRFHLDAIAQMELPLGGPAFEYRCDPGRQFAEIGTHLVRDRRGNHGQFRRQHRANTHGHRALAYALGPVIRVGRQPPLRVLDVLIERRQPLPGLLAMLRDHSKDQVRLGREMMMDAGLADMDPFGHIGIAEPVIAPGGKQLPGLLDDLDCPGGKLQTHRNPLSFTEKARRTANASGRKFLQCGHQKPIY
ncbi:hypothetical protein D9M68_430300 [compost metagenome]